MNADKVIRDTEVAMLTGRRLSPRQIEHYKTTLRMHRDSGYIEVLTLLFAEAMADSYGREQTAEVMHRLRDLQNAFTKECDEGMTIDDLIVRVYEKTGLIFPMEKGEEAYIKNLLQSEGYDVEVLEGD